MLDFKHIWAYLHGIAHFFLYLWENSLIMHDFLGKPLYTGDDVVFIKDNEFKKGTIITFYSEELGNTDIDGLNEVHIKCYTDKELKEMGNKYPSPRIFVHVGFDYEYETDHYGHTVGDGYYRGYLKIAPWHLIKF